MIGAACACIGGCGSDSGPKRVFVSSTHHTGNLGGVDGGNAACQDAADAATAAGLHDFGDARWTVWLSDRQTDAIDRLADVGPWFRVDDSTLVFNNKAHVGLAPAQLTAAIGTDERGTPLPASDAIAWTGTNPGGELHQASCVGWTSALFVDVGIIGNGLATDNNWTNSTQERCDQSNRLICFER